ncbi:MAG TPA: lysophospholipid acyltransferase family protein [Mariprofundaceae bacterium]|nr:lysophospholipid acyltransferase family protein [Mariprofundaceae bacterium]
MKKSKLKRRGPGKLLRALNRLFCCGWHRLSRQGFRLPDGPVILVGNHLCGLDPLLIQASVNRPLFFLMAREYYAKMWYVRWIFNRTGAVPVNPGGANRHALKLAIDAVRRGNAICLFPEGEANPTIPLRRILPGAVIIAQETGAPIIPFRISGVWPFDHVHIWTPFLRRSRARVVIGQPIQLPEAEAGKPSLREGCKVIGESIRRLSHDRHG